MDATRVYHSAELCVDIGHCILFWTKLTVVLWDPVSYVNPCCLSARQCLLRNAPSQALVILPSHQLAFDLFLSDTWQCQEWKKLLNLDNCDWDWKEWFCIPSFSPGLHPPKINPLNFPRESIPFTFNNPTPWNSSHIWFIQSEKEKTTTEINHSWLLHNLWHHKTRTMVMTSKTNSLSLQVSHPLIIIKHPGGNF